MATLTTDRVLARSHRLAAPLAAAAAAGAGALALHLRDPHVSGAWGFCPTKLLTGLECPGCGALRAVNDLTNLEVAAAASSNLLLVAALPLVAWLWLRWARHAWAGRPGRVVTVSAPVLVALLVVVLGFALLRNLPAGAWLAP